MGKNKQEKSPVKKPISFKSASTLKNLPSCLAKPITEIKMLNATFSTTSTPPKWDVEKTVFSSTEELLLPAMTETELALSFSTPTPEGVENTISTGRNLYRDFKIQCDEILCLSIVDTMSKSISTITTVSTESIVSTIHIGISLGFSIGRSLSIVSITTIGRIVKSIAGIAKSMISTIEEVRISFSLGLGVGRPLAIVAKMSITIGGIVVSNMS